MIKHLLVLISLFYLQIAEVYAAEITTIPVDSSAFVYSPANWTGDRGREGSAFRQTWYPGAYFRVTWETTNEQPGATLLFDMSGYPDGFQRPRIVYNIDGVWSSSTSCAEEVPIENLSKPGKHELVVYLVRTRQEARWGSEGKSGINVLRLQGLKVDAESKPITHIPQEKWALIIGDSITEGIGATELAGYSHLVGQSLQTQGYEYAISACGWSGWINKGDNPPGDVPGYYVVTGSENGMGGQYDDAASRWNKIDGNNHSLLDANGHLSAYGQTNQEPDLIMINYGTNDRLHKSDPSDTLASMTQSLAAFRKSAPDAQIILLVPFGQYYAAELKQAAARHQEAHPQDTRLAIIDLGQPVAKSLAVKKGLFGGLHPNDRGHANFAAKIIPQVMTILDEIEE
ncbi:SGNH/GDSL hydrolase family protein [Calycomorphotria hydatis]|uniref:GDSL-like Lipase/Acylhydrolase n=1 Tax=Calycomorphotria hydatis TaxID=2528027 RepID=A0A517T463_9PLAN|nr:SGNH/GDSL hydrolase family protein [Calycomorphotria hydatis]QDT63165.1 GDSL-like Lipase/Acylhydrolase [Calycomorphotria hydatis]